MQQGRFGYACMKSCLSSLFADRRVATPLSQPTNQHLKTIGGLCPGSLEGDRDVIICLSVGLIFNILVPLQLVDVLHGRRLSSHQQGASLVVGEVPKSPTSLDYLIDSTSRKLPFSAPSVLRIYLKEACT